MKKILLDENKKYYKANLHCHTTESDGVMTPVEVKELYKAHGYSVIAFTDHEHLIDNSYLNDDDFLALTGCEVAIKQFPDQSTLVKTDMKVCHLNFIAKRADNVDTPCYSSIYDHFLNESNKDKVIHSCGEYERVYSHEGIAKMIKCASDNGFLVTYNHPSWSLENASDYLGYKGLWAVEAYNHSCMVAGLFEYDIHAYDDLLRSGERIGCVFADDNHSLKGSVGGWVMVNAEKLGYDSIISALEKHEFYSSNGPVIKSLVIEDDKAVLTYEKGAYATISCQSRRAQRKYAENIDGENVAVFDILPDKDGYIRFDVVDKDGNRANTNAYFCDELYGI
ncbi:MAG: hypothetical protein E7583_08350 [Ruminococcaceae bacterium]|nr:hypothetical protein [Oscillospiraceae bacterium]